MPELTKEEKKALLRQWKAAQNKKYILSRTKAQKLLRHLDGRLAETPCDNTLRLTEQWLAAHVPPERREQVLAELREMGGYCDCEVLMNCYEHYDI